MPQGLVTSEADLPHRTWICERCDAENSCLDAECQFCDPPEQIREDWEADHRIDQRKHER